MPTIRRVKGISATIRIRKGIERNRLTKAPRARFRAGASKMPPLSLVTRMTANGMPSTRATNDETPTIRKVSITPCSKRSNHIAEYLHLLCPNSCAVDQGVAVVG
ncbi:hypothetical protein D3C86_1702180 [compost metagenome]